METRFEVGPENAGERLDVFLSEAVGDISRSQLKKRIKAGDVLVNGKTASVHHFLKAEDIVELKGAGREARGAVNEAVLPRTHRSARRGVHDTLSIIAETPSWLVAYKPTGMLMHPTAASEENTFIDAVIVHAPEVTKVGGDPAEPGIISRLDRDVSGIVIVAKTERAYEHLKQQFKDHRVEKSYLALVHGEVPKDSGDLKFRIARSASNARMAARPSAESEGRAAWTHYIVRKRFQGATLLSLQILTGRTHQIRAHLFAFNHPVIGDALYVPRSTKRRIEATRLMLQSVALAFDDPETGERKRFEVDPDPEFESLERELSVS